MGVHIGSITGGVSGTIAGGNVSISGRSLVPLPQYHDAWSSARKMTTSTDVHETLYDLCKAVDNDDEEAAKTLTDRLFELAPDVLTFLTTTLPTIFMAVS
jgi:hypothetical protein